MMAHPYGYGFLVIKTVKLIRISQQFLNIFESIYHQITKSVINNAKRKYLHLISEGKQMDEIDKEIIRILKQDGRATYSEIGKKIGLSEGAVRKRIRDHRRIRRCNFHIRHEHR